MIGFVALISISFAIFGLNNVFSANPNIVATVGSEKITTVDLKRRFDFFLNQKMLEEEGYTRETAYNENLDRVALQHLVSRAVYKNLADDEGIDISQESIRKNLRETEAFQNPVTGEFDPDTFRRAIDRINLNETSFAEEVRVDLLLSRFRPALEAGVAVPDSLAHIFARSQTQSTSLDYVRIRNNLVKIDPPAPPSELDLQAHYQKSSALYTIPEKRRFTLALVSKADLMHQVEVTEEEVKALYEARGDTYNIPEKRAFTSITVEDSSRIERLLAELKVGKSPEQITKALGLPSPVEHALGERDGIFDPNVAQAVFSAEKIYPLPGGVIEPQHVADATIAPMLVWVTQIEEAKITSLDDVKGKLREEIQDIRLKEKIAQAVSKILRVEARGASLPDAAGQAGIPSISTGFVDDKGLDEKKRVPRYLLGDKGVLAEVFQMEIEEVSDPIELKNGNYAFVRLDAIKPSKLRPLDEEEVRKSVLASWTAEQRLRDIKIYVDGYETQAKTKGLEAIANLSPDGIERLEDISPLNQRFETIPSQLVTSALTTKPGDWLKARSADGWIIARVAEKKPGDLVKIEEMAGQIQPFLAQQINQAAAGIYLRALDETYPAVVNEAALARASGRDQWQQ